MAAKTVTITLSDEHQELIDHCAGRRTITPEAALMLIIEGGLNDWREDRRRFLGHITDDPDKQRKIQMVLQGKL